MSTSQSKSSADATSPNEDNVQSMPGTNGNEGVSQDREKLSDNQKALNVGPDHKTKEMEEQHRGTFP